MIEAKKACIKLLENLNSKFVTEFKKNPENKFKFMESKFSQVSSQVRKSEDISCADILKLVQTNMIKVTFPIPIHFLLAVCGNKG